MPSFLADLIRAEIVHRGPIPFRDFMELALYHPEHGYYTSGCAAIGRHGDFFTNVSVGPLFGRLLAEQFAEIWRRFGSPEHFTIVEQGAHDGQFALDVLSHLQHHAPIFAKAARYVVVEPAPRACEVQRKTLQNFAQTVRWADSLADLSPFIGVHFSNELIDAFPVHAVKWTGSRWIERRVGMNGESLVFADGELSSPALAAAVSALPPVQPGYETEINLAAGAWLDALSAKLERGCLLAIDYGFPYEEYYRPDRISGTLSAYAAHRREPDPLVRPGEIDLTAHVEFTSLAAHGLRLGFELAGFADQHHFIVGLSRLHFSDAPPVTAAAQKALRALQTLMHPSFMGRSFEALCLARGMDAAAPLAGFQFAANPKKALGIH